MQTSCSHQHSLPPIDCNVFAFVCRQVASHQATCAIKLLPAIKIILQ